MQGYNTGNKINHTTIIKPQVIVFLLDFLTATNIKVIKIFFFSSDYHFQLKISIFPLSIVYDISTYLLATLKSLLSLSYISTVLVIILFPYRQRLYSSIFLIFPFLYQQNCDLKLHYYYIIVILAVSTMEHLLSLQNLNTFSHACSSQLVKGRTILQIVCKHRHCTDSFHTSSKIFVTVQDAWRHVFLSEIMDHRNIKR